jgi:lysophospholipase L1-like esterase
MQATHSPPTSDSRCGPAKKLGLLAASLLPVLLLLEVGWRTYLWSAGQGFLDDPNEFVSPFFTTYEQPPPIKSGSDAWYRDDRVPITKPDREIRIVCFGGSTTLNKRAGVSYPQLLDESFSDLAGAYSVRVLNAGGEGFSTAHTLVNLSLRNLELAPDIIIVYHNINDLSVKDFGSWASSDYANKYKSDFYLGLRHRTGAVAQLVKISRLARFLMSRIQNLEFPRNEYGEVGRTSWTNDHSQVLTYFKSNLRSIAAIAREHGIRLVLASQPARSDFRRDEGFSAFNEALQQAAEDEGAVFVDVAGMMTEDDFFLEDGIHYTAPGVERLADILYPHLRSLVAEVVAERLPPDRPLGPPS